MNSAEKWALKNPELRQIISDIRQQRDVIAMVVHGSSAYGKCDNQSDVDLLAVIGSGPTIHESQGAYSLPVDVYAATASELRAKLYTVDPLNNNFVLNALVSGIVVFDADGSAASLQAEARTIWARGPQAMSMAEYRRTQTALHRMLASAEKWSLRSSISDEAGALAAFRRTQVVVQSIYLYHRVRGLWTSGLPQILTSMKDHHRSMYDLWFRYVTTSEEDEQLTVVRTMVNIVFQKEQFRNEDIIDQGCDH